VIGIRHFRDDGKMPQQAAESINTNVMALAYTNAQPLGKVATAIKPH
jgi:hypothetical protein